VTHRSWWASRREDHSQRAGYRKRHGEPPAVNTFCFSTVSITSSFKMSKLTPPITSIPSPSISSSSSSVRHHLQVRLCRALHNHTKTVNAGPALTCKRGCKLGTVSSGLQVPNDDGGLDGKENHGRVRRPSSIPPPSAATALPLVRLRNSLAHHSYGNVVVTLICIVSLYFMPQRSPVLRPADTTLGLWCIACD
jgi:hypothetical protein